MAEYRKYSKKYPEITQCSVVLERESYIEKMLENYKCPKRVSARVLNKKSKEFMTTNKPSTVLSVAPKSILINKNRLRQRSKSVTFERKASPPSNKNMPGRSFAGMSGLTMLRRLSVDTAAMLELKAPEQKKDDVNGNFGSVRAAMIESDRISAYEKRIKELVDSNKTHVHEISVLMANKDILHKQIQDLHGLNLALTRAVDDMRAEPANDPNASNNVIATLERQNGTLQTRIESLNARMLHMHGMNVKLAAKNRDFRDRDDKNKSMMTMMQSQKATLEEKIHELQSELKSLRESQN